MSDRFYREPATPMTTDEAVGKIMAAFLALPWNQRSKVFAAVRYNNVFCVECGQGEITSPNPRCQCDNDE